MAKEPEMRLQEAFLNEVKTRKHYVNIYLANGIKLLGRVSDYDNYTIAIVDKYKPVLVYKNSIASIAIARQPDHTQSQYIQDSDDD